MKKYKLEVLILAAGILMTTSFSNGIVFAAQNVPQNGSQDNGQAVRVKSISSPKAVKANVPRTHPTNNPPLTNLQIAWPNKNISVKKWDFNNNGVSLAGGALSSSHYLVIDGSGTVSSPDLTTGNRGNYRVELYSPTSPPQYRVLRTYYLSNSQPTQDGHTFSFTFGDIIPIHNIPNKATQLTMRLMENGNPNDKIIQETKFNLPTRPDAAYQPQIPGDGASTYYVTAQHYDKNEIQVYGNIMNAKHPNNHVVPARIVSQVLDAKGKVIAGTTKDIAINNLQNDYLDQRLDYGNNILKRAVSMRLTVKSANGAVLGTPVILPLFDTVGL